LGQTWTNPNVGLKMQLKKCTVEKVKVKVEFGSRWVTFLHYIFNPAFWVCPYLTQNWVKTTQHFFRV